MAMEHEIEKKYQVLELPTNLNDYEYMEIEQSYLNKGGAPIRLRKFKDRNSIRCVFSKKARLEEGSFECIEHNIELPEDIYNQLVTAKEGRTIFKTRYRIPIDDNLNIDLDVFHDFFEGLCIAEIEYSSIEQANSFCVPNWLGKEVTTQEEFANGYMATKANDISEYNSFMLSKHK